MGVTCSDLEKVAVGKIKRQLVFLVIVKTMRYDFD